MKCLRIEDKRVPVENILYVRGPSGRRHLLEFVLLDGTELQKEHSKAEEAWAWLREHFPVAEDCHGEEEG